MEELNNQVIVSMDISASRVAIFVAEISSSNHIKVKGMGIKKYAIPKHCSDTDREPMLLNAVREAITEAERTAQCKICSVYMNVAVKDLCGIKTMQKSFIKGRSILQSDIDAAIERAEKRIIFSNHKVLYSTCNAFFLDKKKVDNPIGLSGEELEVEVYFIFCEKKITRFWKEYLQQYKLVIEAFIPETTATMYALKHSLNKSCCIIDIGYWNANLFFLEDKQVHFFSTIAVAGHHVTLDIAKVIDIPFSEAEAIKKKYGQLSQITSDQNQGVLSVSCSNTEQNSKQISRIFLTDVIRARYQEIFSMVQKKVQECSRENNIKVDHFILLGGGAEIEGVVHLAEKILQVPIISFKKLENKHSIKDYSHIISTGILRYGYLHRAQQETIDSSNDIIKGLKKIKEWFKNNF